jgi:hypothetical protein
MDRHTRRAVKRKDVSEYRLIFGICFTVFLVAAVVSRLLPWSWKLSGTETKRKSVVEEAHDAANTVLPYAFMS